MACGAAAKIGYAWAHVDQDQPRKGVIVVEVQLMEHATHHDSIWESLNPFVLYHEAQRRIMPDAVRRPLSEVAEAR